MMAPSTDPRQGDRLSSYLQKWPAFVVGGAGAAYVFGCLPELLRPTGPLAALLIFCSGLTVGVLCLVVVGVYLFFKLATLPQPQRPVVSPDAQAVEVPSPSSPELDSLTAAQRQALYDAVVQEMIRNAGRDAPPHPYGVEGKYAGWLWAMPGSKYDRTEALANWPPSTEGPKPLATRWWAHLQGQSLLLARTSQLEHSDRVPVVCVPLSGCSVEIVTEGLRGKTRWWRKAPLELANPQQQLLGNEHSIMLFAAGSAAKEQWFTVLRRAAGVDGGAGAAAEAMYVQFCESVRAGGMASCYPQEGDAHARDESKPDKAAAEGSSPKKEHKGKGGAWGKWWSRKGSRDSPEPPKPKPQPEAKEKRSRDKSPKKQRKPLPTDAPLPDFLNPQEMEKAWMGGRQDAPAKPLSKITSQSSAVPPLKERKSGKSAANRNRPAVDPSAGAGKASPGTPDAVEQQQLAAAAADTIKPDIIPAASMPIPHSVAENKEAMTRELRDPEESSIHPSLSGPALLQLEPQMQSGGSGALPHQSGSATPFYEDVNTSHIHSKPQAQPADTSPHKADSSGHAEAPAAASGTAEQSREGASQRATQAAPPTGLPTEVAVNMLLARVAFDLLRNESFREKIKAHVQRKLNELRLPDFIHSIDAMDIDMGSAVPRIYNLRALPTPDTLIWPQIMFDLEYEGCVKVTIETKLHVRDHAMWSQLDQAITRVAGAVDENETPFDSDDEALEFSGGTKARAEPVDTQLKPDKPEAPQKRRLMDIRPLRRRFAEGIRQIAEVTADRVARMQLRLQLDIQSVKGPIVAWVPPPPGDRLWFSFTSPPELVADARPLVSGRMLKYVAQAGRVSQFIAAKLQSSIAKNMLFPSCSDIKLPHLLPADDIAAALALPSFAHAIQGDDDKGDDDKGMTVKPAKAPAATAAHPQAAQPAPDSGQARTPSSAPVTPMAPSSPAVEHVPVARVPHRGSSLEARRSTREHPAPPAPGGPPGRPHEPAVEEAASHGASPQQTVTYQDAAHLGPDSLASGPSQRASITEAPVLQHEGGFPPAEQPLRSSAGSATLPPNMPDAPPQVLEQPHEDAPSSSMLDPLGALQQHYSENVRPQSHFGGQEAPEAPPASLPRQSSLPPPSPASSSSQPFEQHSMRPSPHTSTEELPAEHAQEPGHLLESSRGPSGPPTPAGEPSRKSTWFQKNLAQNSSVAKNWESFKTRNPNTVTQGLKLAGTVASWRDQAQERMRSAMQAKDQPQGHDKPAAKQQ